LPQAEQNFLNLHRAWLRQRLDEIEAVVAQTPFGRMPQIAAKVLDQRNQNWIPGILAAAASGKRTLIAVGALHLPRSNGLLALLAKAGHELRPIVTQG